MWEMFDDVTGTIGSSAKLLREFTDRELMKESAKTSAVQHTLQKKSFQIQMLAEVEK